MNMLQRTSTIPGSTDFVWKASGERDVLMQFELDCRPFYVAGFNAHDLMPKALATPEDHKTTGGQPTVSERGIIFTSSPCIGAGLEIHVPNAILCIVSKHRLKFVLGGHCTFASMIFPLRVFSSDVAR